MDDNHYNKIWDNTEDNMRKRWRGMERKKQKK